MAVAAAITVAELAAEAAASAETVAGKERAPLPVIKARISFGLFLVMALPMYRKAQAVNHVN